jgi:hypothetical protein
MRCRNDFPVSGRGDVQTSFRLKRTEITISPQRSDLHRMHNISVFRTSRELEQLRPLWSGWNKHPNSDLDFFEFINRQRPQILSPYVVLVQHEREPTAILVGRIEEEYQPLRIGYKNVGKLKVRSLSIVYGGILGCLSDDAMAVVLKHFEQELGRGMADRVVLKGLREDSPVITHARRFVSWYCRSHVSEYVPHWTMKVPQAMDDFWAKMKSKHRSWIRRNAARLEKDFSGKVMCVCHKSEEAVERVSSEVERVAQRTYQRGLAAGYAHNAENINRLKLEARQGWLRVYLLYVNDAPKAFWIGSVYDGVFHSAFTGYDPAFKSYELGTLLLVRLVEMLANEGVTKIDFGLGDAFYKRRFGDQCWREATLCLYAPRPKPILVNGLVYLTETGGKMGRALLERYKLGDKVKRLWRNHLAKAAFKTIEEQEVAETGASSPPDDRKL